MACTRTFRRSARLHLPLLGAVLLLAVASTDAAAQAPFTVENVLSPGYPLDLTSAKRADRIAWIEYERGLRNVYTAAAPDFTPVRLTAFMDDDGVDLSGTQISDDGAVVAFVRGHAANGDGWVANPSSDPRGAERAVWAVGTRGGKPWRVVEANSFSLSPDGRWVVYSRGGQIYRAAVNPGAGETVGPADPAPLFRAYGNNSSPEWSPDGSRIAFVSDRGGHSFIGVYDVRSPHITYLAPSVDRDGNPTWSPDGTRIAFTRRPGDAFGAWADRGGDQAGGGRGRQGGPPDGRQGAPPGGRRAGPPPGGQGGPPGAGRGALPWPDGVISGRLADGSPLAIWVADAVTGRGEQVWSTGPTDSTWTGIRNITWVSDRIVFPQEITNWPHWYSLPADGSGDEPVLLTPGDGEVETTAFSKDGRFLYYSANMGDIDRRDVFRVPVGGGRPTQVTKGDGVESYPAPLASGEQVALFYADAKRPQSVALVRAGGGDARPITTLPPRFPLDEHVVPQNVMITAEDGLEFHNQLFLPPDLRPGQKRPALIFIHGGSRRQMMLGYHNRHFYHMAYGINQYFANKGYIVLSVNYRSGIGYGREFRTAPDVGRRGNAEYLDIIAAGRYLQSRPDVDSSRVALWGLSYGGVLTAQGLARNSDVFKAGVDIAGVHLWGNSIDPESTSYLSSAISAVDKWTSPVLLIHADDDRNVEFAQTVGLVMALRANSVPHELIVFPDDVHDFLIHERWLISFNAADDFFQRVLINKEPVRVEAGGGG